MNKIITLAWILAFLSVGLESAAKIRIYSTGGIGLAYPSAKNGEMSYTPIGGIHGSSIISIPLSPKITLESGGTYTLKGYNNHITSVSGNEKVVYNSEFRFHYLSIPILLNYNCYQSAQSKIWIGAGMSYGFFVAGTENLKVKYYENDKEVSTGEQTIPVIGVMSNSTYLKAPQGKRVQLLDAMFRLQVNYVLKDRYILGVFHEHGLQDIDAKMLSDAQSIIKLRYTGLSLGFIWN